MKCIACEKAQMVHGTHDIPHTYKGQTTTIKDAKGYYCPLCNESLHNAEESTKLNAAMLAFNKEVNAASVDPEFITQTRKKLNLDQQKAGELFGGGPNGFSRYEHGKTKPSLALVQLFRILDQHPDLLKELQLVNPEVKEASAGTKGSLTRRRKLPTKA